MSDLEGKARVLYSEGKQEKPPGEVYGVRRTQIGADGRQMGWRGKEGDVNGNKTRIMHFYVLFKSLCTLYSPLIFMPSLKTQVLTSISHFEVSKNSLITACKLDIFYDLNVIISQTYNTIK